MNSAIHLNYFSNHSFKLINKIHDLQFYFYLKNDYIFESVFWELGDCLELGSLCRRTFFVNLTFSM